MNKSKNDFIIFILFLIAGILLGTIINRRWNENVTSEVKKELSKVVMIDVPPIDVKVSEYLEEHNYEYKYITAIDIDSKDYGIYEINNENNTVHAYAHGKCENVGDIKEGIYEIVDTQSHLDYHDVRYWRIVNLRNVDNKSDEIVVSSSGYEIADTPEEKVESEGFGNVMIDSGIMLTVYDNAEEGIVLIVCGGGDSVIVEPEHAGKGLNDDNTN